MPISPRDYWKCGGGRQDKKLRLWEKANFKKAGRKSKITRNLGPERIQGVKFLAVESRFWELSYVKQLIGILVFAVSFFVAGVVMHLALYEKPGIFVWSYTENPTTGVQEFRRTVLLPRADQARVIAADVATAQSAAQQEEAESPASEPATEPKQEVAEVAESAEVKAEEGGAKKEEPSKTIKLFNGKDLGKWKKTQFGGEGDVFVNEDGNLEFGFGAVMTGVNWGEKAPATSNYEIRLEAMKLDGNDFFCALTFPVKDSHATFVVGGWGGGVVGISSVDDLNASENETMNIEGFEDKKWFAIRVRVTDKKLEAWIGDEQMVDLALKDRKISLLPGDIELSVPVGVASFQTRAQYRNLVWENLEAE